MGLIGDNRTKAKQPHHTALAAAFVLKMAWLWPCYCLACLMGSIFVVAAARPGGGSSPRVASSIKRSIVL